MGVIKIITCVIAYLLNLFSCCCCIQPEKAVGCVEAVAETIHDATGD